MKKRISKKNGDAENKNARHSIERRSTNGDKLKGKKKNAWPPKGKSTQSYCDSLPLSHAETFLS